MEATHEHKLIKDELKNVAAMPKELIGSANNGMDISDILKRKVERHELRFKKVVNALGSIRESLSWSSFYGKL
ncbi:hypothetical protein HanHA300_Chr09g0313581 [Helianthus annuus]|nr:hypothetical protein HanHA300_Chr09g0313581 [Helianthus annuus]KAJ0541957.1 hypothetical protein HanHA89_Chr09g0334471 [Helianthus annuus]KAJ0707025.1 hypothetical protein HanLR1_Chr09g0313841 [Helianthus annuus]